MKDFDDGYLDNNQLLMNFLYETDKLNKADPSKGEKLSPADKKSTILVFYVWFFGFLIGFIFTTVFLMAMIRKIKIALK